MVCLARHGACGPRHGWQLITLGLFCLRWATLCLLLGLNELGNPLGWGFLGGALVLIRFVFLGRTPCGRPDFAAAPVPRPVVQCVDPAWDLFRHGRVWQAELCAVVCPGRAGHQRDPGRHHPDAHVVELDIGQYLWQPSAAEDGLPYAVAHRHGGPGSRGVADVHNRERFHPGPGHDLYRHDGHWAWACRSRPF